MARAVTKIKGWDEFQRMMKSLPNSMKHREIRGVQRKLVEPVKNDARRIADGKGTGKGIMFQAIGVRTKGNDQRGFSSVMVGVHRAAKRRYRAFHWHLVAFGTNDRKVNPAQVMTIGGRVFTISHTGSTDPNPYMDEAVAKNQNALTSDQERKVQKYLERKIKRLNNRVK